MIFSTPDFSQIQMEMGIKEVLEQSGSLVSFTRQLSDLHKDIFGDQLSLKGIEEILNAPMEEMEKDLIEEIARKSPPPMFQSNNPYGCDSHALTVNYLYDFSKMSWGIKAEMHLGYVCSLSTDFLELLKAKRPDAYSLFRKTIEVVCSLPFLPVHSLEDIYSWFMDFHSDYDPSDVEPGTFESAKDEHKQFRKHLLLRTGKTWLKKAAIVKKEYESIKRVLSKKERMWIETSLELISLTKNLYNAPVYYDDDEYSESASPDLFFNVVWSHEKYLEEWFYESLNCDLQNMDAPRIGFIIKNRDDLEQSLNALHSLVLYQKFFDYGEEVGSAIKNKKSRK